MTSIPKAYFEGPTLSKKRKDGKEARGYLTGTGAKDRIDWIAKLK